MNLSNLFSHAVQTVRGTALDYLHSLVPDSRHGVNHPVSSSSQSSSNVVAGTTGPTRQVAELALSANIRHLFTSIKKLNSYEIDGITDKNFKGVADAAIMSHYFGDIIGGKSSFILKSPVIVDDLDSYLTVKNTATLTSLENIDLPYPRKGTIVVSVVPSDDLSKLSKDLGDYISISTNIIGGKEPVPAYLVIGVSNTDLTDFYTPFEGINYIKYYEGKAVIERIIGTYNCSNVNDALGNPGALMFGRFL